jgi:hypothetical protein
MVKRLAQVVDDLDPRIGFDAYWEATKHTIWVFHTDTEEQALKTFALALWNAAVRHSDACDTRYFDGLADGRTEYREMLGTAVKIIRGLLASDDLSIGYGEYIGDANSFLTKLVEKGTIRQL